MLKIKPLADNLADALKIGAKDAPYLARLMLRQNDLVDQMRVSGPEDIFQDIIDDMSSVALACDQADAMSALRQAKQKMHLLLSAADLSGEWPVMKITHGMTRFADAAATAALDFALRAAGLKADGLFIIALGKMGAGELNYSSDIDIAAFYDPDIFEGGERGASEAASRVVRRMARLLEEQTGEGYVLRTDLRLRPDPRSTPVAVSTRMAELYYESVGQNWERMVWIKARPFAGDLTSAERFQSSLKNFVWRNHLDYWAINDIHAIKDMINASADKATLDLPHADVKLGPGGIREIEFFVQTQQLILGGRDPALRMADTLGALQALAERGAVEKEMHVQLHEAYLALRAVEHRVQMRLDQQTHTLPVDDDKRLQVARLCGISQLSEFDSAIRETRACVHDHYTALFSREARGVAAARHGNLVFTGVDDDPGTLETLAGFGFQAPAEIIDTVRHWHRGHTSATRTSRGRELLTALLPELLSDMGDTGEPDTAFRHITSFLENLPSGVQTLSMLLAEENLRRDLVATLALAPRLGTTLGRKPDLLEALLQRNLISPPAIQPVTSFEDAMNMARLYVSDQGFLIGHDLLHGRVAAKRSAAMFTDLADWTIDAMATAAEAECIRRFGPVPGDWCIAALGKLGGRAMTARSDLDIMVLYEPEDTENAQAWFTRFTQRLITALSTQTSEGGMYEVDMRLRPSGRSGPVAVRMASFETYHREEAWTWEQMALTRLRPVSDRNELGNRLRDMAGLLLARERNQTKLREDVLDMRQRLSREKPGQGLWDLKQGEGGLVDLEFIIQHALLELGTRDAAEPELPRAIDLLVSAKVFTSDEAAVLQRAHDYLTSLQQVQRIALTGHVVPETASAGLKDRLVRAVGLDDFEVLTETLRATKRLVADIREERIGPLSQE